MGCSAFQAVTTLTAGFAYGSDFLLFHVCWSFFFFQCFFMSVLGFNQVSPPDPVLSWCALLIFFLHFFLFFFDYCCQFSFMSFFTCCLESFIWPLFSLYDFLSTTTWHTQQHYLSFRRLHKSTRENIWLTEKKKRARSRRDYASGCTGSLRWSETKSPSRQANMSKGRHYVQDMEFFTVVWQEKKYFLCVCVFESSIQCLYLL